MVIGMKNDRKRIFTFEQYQSALHLLRFDGQFGPKMTFRAAASVEGQ